MFLPPIKFIKTGPEVWAFLYGRNKPLLYLAVPTILTSTFFFFNFALNKRQLDQIRSPQLTMQRDPSSINKDELGWQGNIWFIHFLHALCQPIKMQFIQLHNKHKSFLKLTYSCETNTCKLGQEKYDLGAYIALKTKVVHKCYNIETMCEAKPHLSFHIS